MIVSRETFMMLFYKKKIQARVIFHTQQLMGSCNA